MRFSEHYFTPSSRCAYLPEQRSLMESVRVSQLSTDEYAQLLLRGWRRFGRTLFRPRCRSCSACQSLRVDVDRFQPDRGQRRVLRANGSDVRLVIGRPTIDPNKIYLYDRFHSERAATIGWPMHPRQDHSGYRETFVDNPFPVEEWCYFVGDDLVGVGLVDVLAIGFSAIYFFHEPAERRRSLGTLNILTLLQEARKRGLPHVYLGYFVSGCRSLSYKAWFWPHELLGEDGGWSPPLPSPASD